MKSGKRVIYVSDRLHHAISEERKLLGISNSILLEKAWNYYIQSEEYTELRALLGYQLNLTNHIDKL